MGNSTGGRRPLPPTPPPPPLCPSLIKKRPPTSATPPAAAVFFCVCVAREESVVNITVPARPSGGTTQSITSASSQPLTKPMVKPDTNMLKNWISRANWKIIADWWWAGGGRGVLSCVGRCHWLITGPRSDGIISFPV